MRQSVDRLVVSGPSFDHHIRPYPAGLDVLAVHRFDAGDMLRLDLRGVSAALRAVPFDPPGEALFGRGRDEDPQGRELSHTRLGQNEEALRQDDGCGLDREATRASRLCDEVVPGPMNGLTPEQRLEVPNEQVGLEAARLVDVDTGPLGGSQVRQIAIVRVVWEGRARDRLQGRPEARHDGGLPRRTPTRDGQEDALTSG